MKKLTFIFAFLIVVIGCRSKFQAFEYRHVKDVKLAMTSFDKIEIAGNLTLFNPNNMDADLQNADLEIFINDILLGVSKQITTAKINRISEFTVPIKVVIATDENSINTLKEIWAQAQNQKVKIAIKGKCKLRKMAIPIEVPVDYSDYIDLNLPKLF